MGQYKKGGIIVQSHIAAFSGGGGAFKRGIWGNDRIFSLSLAVTPVRRASSILLGGNDLCSILLCFCGGTFLGMCFLSFNPTHGKRVTNLSGEAERRRA